MKRFEMRIMAAMGAVLIGIPVALQAGEGADKVAIGQQEDEIDRALDIEEMSDEDAGIQVDPVSPEEMIPPPMVMALESKAQELEKARREIERLKSYILRIRDANKQEKAIMYYNMGCVYRAGKLFEKAEQSFLKALEYNAMLADAHYNLAILYDDDLANQPKAKEHYKAFLTLAPDDAAAAQVVEWLASLKPVMPGR